MPIRLSRFEMPHNIEKKEGNATGTYARFVAEPFEIGYARTIGNSLRRVLLSLRMRWQKRLNFSASEQTILPMPSFFSMLCGISKRLKRIGILNLL